MGNRDNETGRFSNSWTEEQEKFLTDNYKVYSTEYIAYVVNKTYDAVNKKAKRLSLKNKVHMIPWNDDEIAIINNNLDKTVLDLVIMLKTKTSKNIESFIKNKKEPKIITKTVSKKTNTSSTKKAKVIRYNWDEEMDNFLINSYGNMTNNEISKKLKLPLHSINTRIKKLKLSTIKRYSEKEIDFIKDNYTEMSVDEMAIVLDRPISGLRTKMSELGLRSVWWDSNDDDFLKDNYKSMSLADIANYLNRSYQGVVHRMSRLHLLRKRFEYDNFIFDSRQEFDVYMFIKNSLGVDVEKNNNFYLNKKINEWYVPDFIINKNKKIIVEYFGMYCDNATNEIFIEYSKKTKRKIEYFNSLEDVCFISLFPKDLNNNFKGVRDKLASF